MRVLFFPLNSPGHLNSSMAIADELRNLYGHECVFMLVGPSIGCSVEERGHQLRRLKDRNAFYDTEFDFGAPLEQVQDYSLDEFKRAHEPADGRKAFEGCLKWPQIVLRNQHKLRLPPEEAFLASMATFEFSMTRELLVMHDEFARTIGELAPDLIVVDAYMVPPCVIKSAKPWVRIHSACPLMLTESALESGVRAPPSVGARLHTRAERELMRRDHPDQWQALLAEWRALAEAVGSAFAAIGGPASGPGSASGAPEERPILKFLREHDCPPPPPGKMGSESPHLNLYLYPAVLDYDQDDDILRYPPGWLRFESLVHEHELAADPKLQQWLRDIEQARQGRPNRPLVYFSLGSIASGNVGVMRRFVRMFAQDPARLYVISKGANGHLLELADNMLGANYVPQTFLLEQCDLAIVHGGNNSISECLHYGKPMIVLPVFADQFDNGQRVEDLKLGKRLHVYNTTKEQILDAIDSLLSNQQLKARVAAIGERMRQSEGPAKAAFMLDKLAKDGQVGQDFIDKCRKLSLNELIAS